MGAETALFDCENDGRIDTAVSGNAVPVHVLYSETPAGNHGQTLNAVGLARNRDGIAMGIVLKRASGISKKMVFTMKTEREFSPVSRCEGCFVELNLKRYGFLCSQRI